MYKSLIACGVLTLGIFGLPQTQSNNRAVYLKEETMVLEYSATLGEAVALLEAESEETINRVEIRNPLGAAVLELRAPEGKNLGLSGFKVETGESSVELLLETYPPGMYRFRARTADGQFLLGSAVLSHELPAAPEVLYPTDGAVDVPTTDLTVSWVVDPQATGYRLVVEQGETDGLVVDLPAGKGSFQVPDGILAPSTRSHVEVGAIGPNGNCTLVEVAFRTL